MKRLNHNVVFVIIQGGFLSLMVLPPFFKWANRVEPWIFGLPFVTFWIILLCLCMCFTMIAWYYVDAKKGNIDIDIEPATEEKMKKWKYEGDN